MYFEEVATHWCPILGQQVQKTTLYEACTGGSCAIAGEVINRYCDMEKACEYRSKKNCLLNKEEE